MSDVVIIGRSGDFQRVPGQVDSPDSLEASATLIHLVKNVADTLERHYAGWMWAVKPDEHGGIVDIFCMRISSKYAYTTHIPRLHEDRGFKRVIRAGGEYLERFGFRRVPYSSEEWHRREMTLGQFIPDVSDLEVLAQRNVRTEIIKAAVASGHARLATNDSIGAALMARAQHAAA
jgi:hypothetical protein